MNIEKLLGQAEQNNYGIEEIRDIKNVSIILSAAYNHETFAPDYNLTKPEDLIRAANLIPANMSISSLYPKMANRKRRFMVFAEQSSADEFLDNEDMLDYEESLPERNYLIERKNADDSKKKRLIDMEFEAVVAASKDFAVNIFSHIQPMVSTARKIEAVRIYESVRELRETAEFLFNLRDALLLTSNLKFCVIPFTINYDDRYYNGIIDAGGAVQFYRTRSLFFNGIQIQKIQRCRICQKFLWIAAGKHNVDKTCSEECAKALKNAKQNEKYSLNASTISQDRKHRKKKKRFDDLTPRIDKYTEKSFLKEFRQDEVMTNLYVAWTETVSVLKGSVPRSAREKLGEVLTPSRDVILGYDVYKNYLPHIIKTQMAPSAVISRTEIEIPAQIYTYFIRYFRAANEKRLEHLWLKATYSELYRKQKRNLREKEERISDIFVNLINQLEWKMKVDKVPPLVVNSEPFMAFLANCQATATALVKQIPIVTGEAAFFANLPLESSVEIIDSEGFFGYSAWVPTNR